MTIKNAMADAAPIGASLDKAFCKVGADVGVCGRGGSHKNVLRNIVFTPFAVESFCVVNYANLPHRNFPLLEIC